jgi:hypothetical protein
MNVQADCEGKSTRNMVRIGADPELDRCSRSCSGGQGLLAKQMLRHAGQCGLMKSSCLCMEKLR